MERAKCTTVQPNKDVKVKGPWSSLGKKYVHFLSVPGFCIQKRTDWYFNKMGAFNLLDLKGFCADKGTATIPMVSRDKVGSTVSNKRLRTISGSV